MAENYLAVVDSFSRHVLNEPVYALKGSGHVFRAAASAEVYMDLAQQLEQRSSSEALQEALDQAMDRARLPVVSDDLTAVIMHNELAAAWAKGYEAVRLTIANLDKRPSGK